MIVWEVNVCLIVEFLRAQFSHVADETSMFFVSDGLHNVAVVVDESSWIDSGNGYLLFTCNQQHTVYAKQFLAQIKVFFRNKLDVTSVRGEITIFA